MRNVAFLAESHILDELNSLTQHNHQTITHSNRNRYSSLESTGQPTHQIQKHSQAILTPGKSLEIKQFHTPNFHRPSEANNNTFSSIGPQKCFKIIENKNDLRTQRKNNINTLSLHHNSTIRAVRVCGTRLLTQNITQRHHHSARKTGNKLLSMSLRLCVCVKLLACFA